MQFTWKSFPELSNQELYEILQARQEVFAVEQKIVYQDCDDKDQMAMHLIARQNGKVVAYLRAFPPGVKYQEASIGRVLSTKEVRGTGAGKKLMLEGLRKTAGEWNNPPIRISAQQYLEKFYQDLGFKTVSEPYIEEDILHIEMLRS